jgi:N-acetylmuramoyl-L-alanine amidase
MRAFGLFPRCLYSVFGLACAALASIGGPPPSLAGDDDALQCLALTIYHEARGESHVGQLAVGNVVMNRTRSGIFPADVCNVVRQGGQRLHACQFSWWCDGLSDRPRDAAAFSASLALAEKIYDGCAADPTNGALWYHTVGLKTAWSKSFGRGQRIDNHVFYRGIANHPVGFVPISAVMPASNHTAACLEAERRVAQQPAG